jgi:hypothetical protein
MKHPLFKCLEPIMQALAAQAAKLGECFIFDDGRENLGYVLPISLSNGKRI